MILAPGSAQPDASLDPNTTALHRGTSKFLGCHVAAWLEVLLQLVLAVVTSAEHSQSLELCHRSRW